MGCAHDDLSLGDLVDGVDVENALSIGAVFLTQAVDAEKAGLAGGIGPAPFADGHRRRTCPGGINPEHALFLQAHRVLEEIAT